MLFQAHLLRLANNMVAMPELMDAGQTALFEQGRLVIDGREFDLSVRVTDAGRAEKFGGMSPIFTMFVMIGDKGGTWTDQIAVPGHRPASAATSSRASGACSSRPRAARSTPRSARSRPVPSASGRP